MMFPLKHPRYIIRQKDEDDIIFDQVVRLEKRRSLYQELRQQLAEALPAPLRNSIRLLKSALVSSRSFPKIDSNK